MPIDTSPGGTDIVDLSGNGKGVDLGMPEVDNGYSWLQLQAMLPVPVNGTRVWLTDSTLTFASANFGATVSGGGGSNKVPLIYLDAWKIG